MSVNKNDETMAKKFKIDLTCDEWYVADSLHELGARIENDYLLDEMQDGRVTVSGDHYTAEITETNEETSECSDDPKEQLLEQWSMTFKDAVLYVRDQMDEDDLTILRAQVNKNYAQHNAPATGIDDSKVIDLLEEYGEDHDLPEGWYLDEYDADDVMLLL